LKSYLTTLFLAAVSTFIKNDRNSASGIPSPIGMPQCRNYC